MTKLAIAAFVRELNLENEEILEGKVDIKEVPAGTYLMKQDSHKVGSITVAHSLRPVSCEVYKIILRVCVFSSPDNHLLFIFGLEIFFYNLCETQERAEKLGQFEKSVVNQVWPGV